MLNMFYPLGLLVNVCLTTDVTVCLVNMDSSAKRATKWKSAYRSVSNFLKRLLSFYNFVDFIFAAFSNTESEMAWSHYSEEAF